MKTMLAALAVFFVLSGSMSQGAILSLQWEGTEGAYMSLNEGETANIVTSVELFEGEILTGFGFANTPIPGDPITQVNFTVEPAGWIMPDVYQNGLNFALGRDDYDSREYQGVVGFRSGADTNFNLYGPGTFVLARQTIQLTDEGDGSDLPITFNMTGDLGGAWNYSPLLIDETGKDMIWSVDYSMSPGFAALGGYGNPGWDGPLGGQPIANPLLVQRTVPEPTSLALLALGGLMLRRRRSFQ